MARIVGTNGNDSLVGTSSADTIEGLAGNDTLVGLGSSDTLLGGTGDDRYVVGSGDVLSDSGGVDTVESTVSWTLGADFENLIFTGTSVTSGTGNDGDNLMIGNSAGNWMRGRGGNDTLIGGGGNDTFNMRLDPHGRYGDDSIDGGSGVDTLDFGASASSEVVIDLGAGTARGGGDSGNGPIGTVVLISVENANGSAFDDRMTGSSASNFLFGYNGNDTIDGAEGTDRLEGGLGNDHYVFSAAPGTANADTVVGFDSGTDKIVLANLDLGSDGNFASNDSRFAFNAAQDADDRVIYNTSSGQLFYDADGNGSGAALLVATLSGRPTLVASDIVAQDSTSSGGGQVINGTEGHDTLNGTAGDDSIDGRGGDDSISGHEGADLLVGGLGNDTLLAHSFSFSDGAVDTLDGGHGNDVYVVGGGDGFDDVILADPSGTDLVIARTSWTLGEGLENLDLEDFFGTSIDGTGNELDNIIRSGSEGGFLRGRGGNDLLIGREVQNSTHLLGEDGNDTLQPHGFGDLFGGAGDDVLIAGGAASQMWGGEGADRFVFVGTGSQYRITDLASGTDKIHLDATSMTALGASGNFQVNDERFHAGSAAAEADDRVIWDANLGELWYDADGSGPGAAELIAWVDGDDVAATDIVVDNGTGQGQVINGTAGNDSILGTSGNDTINGFGGNDTIEGVTGSDSLNGGSGNDSIVGGAFDPDNAEGGDMLVGGDGDDTLNGTNHWMWANDVNVDTLAGGLGNDVYWVDNGADVLTDAGGTDTVHAANTSWTLGAGFENLVLVTDEFEFDIGIGNELGNHMSITWAGRLEGMGGNDTLVGGRGGSADELFGGEGNDSIVGSIEGKVARIADGGSGDDTLSGGFEMTGGSGADVFDVAPVGVPDDATITDFATASDKVRLDGESFQNVGPSGNFASGDERFYSAAGATEAHDETDRLIYNTDTGVLAYDADGSGSAHSPFFVATLQGAPALAASDITVTNGSTPPPSGGQTINGTSAPETLTGGAGNDTISGGAGSDRLFGRDGNDSLLGGTEADNMFGENGDDWLDGDAGQDRLNGGAGADSFVFNDPVGITNADYVNDFVSGVDKLLLDNAVMAALGGTGTLSAGDERFVAAPNARSGLEADDRLMYDTVSGKLYYDPDGNGSAGQQVIAVITGAPALAPTDITVI